MKEDTFPYVEPEVIMANLRKKFNLPWEPGQILMATGRTDLHSYPVLIKIDHYEVEQPQRHYPNGWIGVWRCYATNATHPTSGLEWTQPERGSFQKEYWDQARYTPISEGEYLALFAQATDVIAGNGNAELLAEIQQLKEGSENDTDVGTSLMAKSDKAQFELMLAQTQTRIQQVRALQTTMNMIIAEKMKQIEAMKTGAMLLVSELMKKVEKIMRIITIFELYLGVEEEIHQIQQGESAPSTDPICFRQLSLYMDEEIAVASGYEVAKEFDYNSIEKFDEWVLKPGHLDILLPESRGIVVLHPRREDKDYGEVNFYTAAKNNANKSHTYFLIRDGQNVSRIYTERLVVKGRLFPKRTALAEMFEKSEAAETDREKEKVEDEMYHYRKLGTFLQGLLDRTQVFGPISIPIKLFNLSEKAEQAIRFIYDDDDNLLSDGRATFKDWWKQQNQHIQIGSRVYLTGYYDGPRYSSRSNNIDRLWYEVNEYNAPSLPDAGMYQVERPPSDKTWGHRLKDVEFCIRYNPGGTVYGSWGDWNPHERKRRIAWAFYPHEDFVIHADSILLEDVQYYLYNRQARRGYISMLPILETIIKMKQKERIEEEPFHRMLSEQCVREQITGVDDAAIWKAIHWWKTKNKWKRAISLDDAKALRMIIKHLKSSPGA